MSQIQTIVGVNDNLKLLNWQRKNMGLVREVKSQELWLAQMAKSPIGKV